MWILKNLGRFVWTNTCFVQCDACFRHVNHVLYMINTNYFMPKKRVLKYWKCYSTLSFFVALIWSKVLLNHTCVYININITWKKGYISSLSFYTSVSIDPPHIKIKGHNNFSQLISHFENFKIWRKLSKWAKF